MNTGPGEKNSYSESQLDADIVPGIVYLASRKCTSGWRLQEAVFPYWDITYVTAGSARYNIDGVTCNLSRGDLLCLPPGHRRSAKTWSGRLMNCYAVNFNLKNLKDQPARLPFPLVSHIGKRAELIRLFQELNVIWLDSRPFYRGNAQALFLLILHRLFELIVYNTNLADFRVQKTIHHIAVHYGEKITVKQMAKMFDLNPLYFGRLFRQETGMTINRHLIKTRIKNAEIMLRNGEYNVEKTAKNCGYNDISCFYKQFKRICGISPAECIPKKDL